METSDIIALSSAVVALCSFFITIWQSIIGKKHNILSVRPHLYIDLNVSKTEPVKLVIKNNGLGPAFLKEFKIFANGNKVTEEGKKLYHQALENVNLAGLDFSYFKLSANQAIPAGSEVDLYTFNNDGTNYTSIEKGLENLDFEIEYGCIYNKTYKYAEKYNLTNQ